ncbi:MAG: right-handed parallel beta-helix repeat-containing protein [Thermoplasmata archaeon]
MGNVSIVENDMWNVTTGIYVDSANVTVEKNTVYLWGWVSYPRGIYSSSSTTMIGNNTLDVIDKNPGWTEVNGIRGTWKLAYNNSVKSYVYGFRVDSSTNPTIRQNHIEGNSAGVRLWGSGVSPLVENNTFVDNVVGVLVQGASSPTILNNTFSSSGYLSAGIKVEYGTPVIEGNEIYSIGQMGIWITSGGNPEISLNTISYNDYGIRVAGGNATIHNSNTIHHNDYGIYIDTSLGAQIDHNTIENNNDYGIYIYSANLTYLNISWNDIENNTDGSGVDYGIYGAIAPSPYWSCKCNWWGNNTGPNDTNPGPPYQNDGDGDRVSNYVDYVNWTRVVGGSRVCDGAP